MAISFHEKLKHVKEKNVTSHKDDIQTYGRIISTDLQLNGILAKHQESQAC